jgi:hypothetical protein
VPHQRTSASVVSVMTSGMTSGRGRGRDQFGREASGAGWHVAGLVACMRRAPRADIYYIDAFTIRASDVRGGNQRL